MYDYYVKTDAGSTTITAASIDAVARIWAAHENIDGIDGIAALVRHIESIDGAWLWIESDDAPDGARVYAGRKNMP